MNFSKTGTCITCLNEVRSGKPVNNERPIFYESCPFNDEDTYSSYCQHHYTFSGFGEPSSFFKVQKKRAETVFYVLYINGVLSKKDSNILLDAIKLI